MKKTKAITHQNTSVTWKGIYFYEYLIPNDLKNSFRRIPKSENEIFLKRAICLYLENIKHYCAQNTFYCYSRDLHYLLEKVGNIKLNNINEENLQNSIAQINNSGLKKLKRSASTMNRIKSVYRSFFSWCLKKNTLIGIYRMEFI
ncbi:MAG: hypothetical protein KJ666_08185 [Bacteroidetes bacterium]|nr:hypothetical protein [Bacteroidota bacterium]MBU2585351.1 hypothetical protein [Bacteroidota bacterium]